MNREDLELYVMGLYDGDVAALERELADDPAARAIVADEARLDLLLHDAGAAAVFCPACGDLVRGARCDACGAVVRPGYTVEHVLVSNAHGRMYAARDVDGKQVALKELAFVQTPAADAPAAFERGRDSDADVLALIGRDTRAALHRLMQRHGRAVYRYCRVALGDAVLADDIHQQVFVEAFRDLPGFAGRSTLRTWLFGIARHRVLDAAKRRRRARAHLDVAAGADLPDPRPSPSEGLDDAQLQAALVTGLAALDEPARTAVLLRYQQGLTYEEMAEICGEKAGTLQARVSRALRKLRDRLEGHLAG